jgi:hypothetical protein
MSTTSEVAASRYRFREHPAGLTVEGDERPPVVVTFRPTGLEAAHGGGGSRERFGFFNFGKLLEFVARGLLRDWQPADGWFGARAWAQQQTARAIARRLREHWLRLVGLADPVVRDVQRAIFAATFGDAPLAAEPGLYRMPFLVRDILNFPACAVAVRNAYTLARDLPARRLLNAPCAVELRQLAAAMGVPLTLNAVPEEEPDAATQLERLGDWKALFSDVGEGYRSLNRTLMNLPGRVPHRLVCNLRKLHLERPLEHRLELLVVTQYAGLRADRESAGVPRADHTRLLQHAKASQVREALARVSRHLRQPLDPRRAADVKQLVQLLADYPEEHAGNLVGLTDRAIGWHRDRHEEHMEAMRQHYGADTPTSAPPIALPEVPGVTFLDTVGAVCAEAERMRHCVASYIDLAVQGNCYLFHVSYQGEDATVEVGCEGKVRQSQGPRNQRNRAAAWGKRQLNRWAKGLPPGGYCGRRYAGGIDPDEIPF